MAFRTTVDFTEQIAPIYRKYAKTYGVKTTCSLGAILVHKLSSNQREKLMSMVAEDISIDKIEVKDESKDNPYFRCNRAARPAGQGPAAAKYSRHRRTGRKNIR